MDRQSADGRRLGKGISNECNGTPEIKSRLKVVKTELLKARYYSLEEQQKELDESFQALFVAYTAYLKRIEDFSLDVQEESATNSVIDLRL